MNNNSPKISVIIPCFNMAEHLSECLESVMGQSLSDIEVLVVDDCSQDGSLDIIEGFAARDSRLAVIRQPHNQGVAAARNKGLRAARGDFIAFLDADDYYPDGEVLKDLFKAAFENQALVCGGGARGLLDGRLVRLSSAHETKDVFAKDDFIEYGDYNYSWHFCRFIYDRRLIMEGEIFFPPYVVNEDSVWFTKVMCRARRFYALARLSYIYRIEYRVRPRTPLKTVDNLSGHLDIMRLALEHDLSGLYAFYENEALIFAERVRRESAPFGSREYLRQYWRAKFYALMARLRGGPARKKYLRKRGEAWAIVESARQRRRESQ